MREHPTPLEECLRRARLHVLEPPGMMDMDGKGLRPPTERERNALRAAAVKRAEDYARWRFHAYELGECAHPY
jgi:hypothetical protein